MGVYLYNRNTGKTYQVMGIADGIITLKNELAEFCDTYDKEKFKRQGYMKIDAENADDAAVIAQAKIAEETANESVDE